MSSEIRLPVTARDGSAAWILIDRDDFPKIPTSIRLDKKGYPVGAVYKGRINGHSRYRDVFLSRIILGVDGQTDVEVDHINRNPLDNRKSNLRRLPRGANSQNVRSHRDSRSRYRGVSWDKTNGYWLARVWVNGSNVTVGRYADEDEAGQAAKDYRLTHMQYAID